MSSDANIELNNNTNNNTKNNQCSRNNVPVNWQPMAGVGELTDEQFVGNYMIDSHKTSSPIETKNQSKKVFRTKHARYLDISEHRALLADEHLSQICVSHIDSSNRVYIMAEDDHERAIQLLQSMRLIQASHDGEGFKPIENRLCAVRSNNEWLRGRCQMISSDRQIVKVQYIDWGNTVHVKSQDLRRLPNEFYQESACCLLCCLDGIGAPPSDHRFSSCLEEVLIGSDRAEFNLDLFVTKTAKLNELARIVLYRESVNLNDAIYQHLPAPRTLTNEEHLIEQLTHELPLIIGEHYRALLSSFNGSDHSFYILIDKENYNEVIEQVLNQITDHDRCPMIIRPLMMVCVKYEGKYSRAWIQSTEKDEYRVFYVDWGNEEQVTKERIRLCPERIRYIPWLANRVKFHREQLTDEEFHEFWNTIESDSCQVFIIDQHKDHYSVEIKYDYLSMIRKRRAKALVNNTDL